MLLPSWSEIAGGRIEGGVCRGGRGPATRAPIELRLRPYRGDLGCSRSTPCVPRACSAALGCQVRTLGEGYASGHRAEPPSRSRARNRPGRRGRATSWLRENPCGGTALSTLPASRGPIATAGRLRDVPVGARAERSRHPRVLFAGANRRFPGSACERRRGRSSSRTRFEAMQVSFAAVSFRVCSRRVSSTCEMARAGATCSRWRGRYAAAPSRRARRRSGTVGGTAENTQSARRGGPPSFGTSKDSSSMCSPTSDGRAIPRYGAHSTDRADLHPRAAAAVATGEQVVGYGGEIHPEVLAGADLDGPILVFELDLGCFAGLASEPRTFRLPPRFPASARDVSLLVADGVSAGTVIEEPRRLVRSRCSRRGECIRRVPGARVAGGAACPRLSPFVPRRGPHFDRRRGRVDPPTGG